MKFLLIIFLLTMPSFAEEIPSLAPKIEPYKLKNRSAFSVNAAVRVPFLPIGWVKPITGAPVFIAPNVKVIDNTPTFNPQPKHFKVTGVLLGDPALATINGRSYAQGDELPVFAGKVRLRVLVKSIRDGGVLLEYEGRQFLCPIYQEKIGDRPIIPVNKAEPSGIQIGG